jgi:Predicted metal-dependent hydrolase of the TIM-barrel fold
MILKDINASYGRYGSSNLYVSNLDSVLELQQKNGILLTAIVDNMTAKSNVKERNKQLLEAASVRSDIVPVPTLLPPSFSIESYAKNELISLIDSANTLFFKIFPLDHHIILTSWQFEWMLDILGESNCSLIVALDDIDIRDLANIKSERPELRIIITGTTQWKNRMLTQLIKTYQKIYIDTCNIIEYFGIELYCREIGSEKILFGSNSPFKEPYDSIFTLSMAEITIEEKENIAFRNFDKLAGRR